MTTGRKPWPWFMEALRLRVKDRICGLWHGTFDIEEDVGTGAFLSIPPDIFILTCEHVVTPFFRAAEARIVLVEGATIQRERCRPVLADKARDIGVIQVSGDVEGLSMFTLEEVAPIPDYTKHDFSYTDFLVCGFPAEKVTLSETRRALNPILYLTGIASDPPPTPSLVYCDYPVRTPVVGSEPDPVLPRPHGLSGSPLFSVPSPKLPRDQVWTLANTRIAGVIITTDNRTFLEATNCADIGLLIEDAQRGRSPRQ